MCTIEMIPQLINAGIDSFKIEGRMKRPEYAAGVTAIYRKYIDQYYENPDKWPFTQIKPFEKERGAQILYLAGSALGREDWIELSKRIGLKGEELDLNSLLYFNL